MILAWSHADGAVDVLRSPVTDDSKQFEVHVYKFDVYDVRYRHAINDPRIGREFTAWHTYRNGMVPRETFYAIHAATSAFYAEQANLARRHEGT